MSLSLNSNIRNYMLNETFPGGSEQYQLILVGNYWVGGTEGVPTVADADIGSIPVKIDGTATSGTLTFVADSDFLLILEEVASDVQRVGINRFRIERPGAPSAQQVIWTNDDFSPSIDTQEDSTIELDTLTLSLS